MDAWDEVISAYYSKPRVKGQRWVWFWHPRFEQELLETYDRGFHPQWDFTERKMFGMVYVRTEQVERAVLLPIPSEKELA